MKLLTHLICTENSKRHPFFADSPICPIEVFTLYVDKLNPNNTNLWQRPKTIIQDPTGPWFDNAPVGVHTLDNFMKKLSVNAGLSTKYTNHSIRSTVITAWDNSNIEARHIIGISGHKSEETIKCYSKRCPTKKKREMADIISEKLGNPPKKCKPNAKDQNPDDPPNEGSSAVPMLSNANFDFEDWVPIDNNKADFELSQIIEAIEKENANVNNPQDIALPVVPKNNGTASAAMSAMPSTSGMPLTTQNSNILNFNQAQSFPIVPKMYFPQSNVTINYNFQSK